MKIKNKLILMLLPFTMLTACGGSSASSNSSASSSSSKKEESHNYYELEVEQNEVGYFIVLKKNGHKITTSNGSIGVRFDKNEYRADDPIFTNYESAVKENNQILANGKISSEYGTEISFTDAFTLLEDRLQVRRYFKVSKVGEDYGFMVEQKWTDDQQAGINDREWFIPGAYYVNGSKAFVDSSSRLYFGGESLVIPSDCVSALIASSLKDGFSMSMMDTSSGYRETDISDIYTTDLTYCHISKNFNFAGILLENEENQCVSFTHMFPSYQNKTEDNFDYRLLPVEEDLERNISYDIFLNEFDNFDSMEKAMWRTAFDHFEYVDKRYYIKDIYDVLYEYVKKSYSANNLWGNIPQYMTFADHFFPDSGFLYRNIEFATNMIRYGLENEDQTAIDNAITVINYQIDNDKIDTKMNAYQRDNSVFKRVMFDGLASVLDLYIFLKEVKFNNSELLDKCYNYILKKAKLYKDEESLMALSFYTRLYKYKDVLFINYDNTALRLMNDAIEKTQNYIGYFGGIENNDERLTVLEDYMIILSSLMNVYDRSKEIKYLNEAIRIADFVETFNFITPMDLNIVGTTGTEPFNFGFIGNERFLAYGYAFNNSGHYILDCCNTTSVIDFYKLYKYTNDAHYLDFLYEKLYNSFLYVNMGDKVGHMDDPLHSSGKGFMNEFVGNATRSEGYPDGGMRGAVHDSVIGWNVYQILYTLDYLKDSGFEGFTTKEDLSHNLSVNKVITIEKDNPLHSVYNITDRLENTYFESESASEFTIDLNEQCFVKNISIEANKDVKILASSDNLNFTEIASLTNINSKFRFVKVQVDDNTQIKNIVINGYPVLYKNLAISASILNKSNGSEKAIDESNYSTVWTAGDNTSPITLELDLGQESEIYQTAITFGAIGGYTYKIEISNDGNTYTEYANESTPISKSVYVNQAFAKARYVKLTVLSSSLESIQIKDFKVMGSY